MIAHARQTILVADASKFRRTAPVAIASLADIDSFVTDAPLPAPLAARARDWPTRIVVAG